MRRTKPVMPLPDLPGPGPGSGSGSGTRNGPEESRNHGNTPTKYSENTILKVDQLPPPVSTPTPGFVYVLTFSSAIGGFLFGYDTGVISGAMILLREEFHLSSVWQELVVSVTIGAAAVFALLGGFLNDRLGRKPVILIASFIFTAGALCMGLANSKELLVGGRVIIGAGIGLSSMTVPMYIAECAPAHKRGTLVVIYNMILTFGQFVASIIDGLFCVVPQGWRYMLGLGGLPSLIQFIVMLFLPESPRWLISKGNEDRARLVLQKIRGEGDIEEEFHSIKQNCEETEEALKARSNSPILWQMLTYPSTRRALIIGCSLQMIQQVAGINTVMYYSATIIKMSGVKSSEAAIWLSAVTASVNFIFTFVGLYLVEKIGRRPLTIGSLIGAIVSLAWLAIAFHLAAVQSPPVTVREPTVADPHCSQYSSCNSCMMDPSCGYCYTDTLRGPFNGSCLMSDYNDPVSSTMGRCNQTTLPAGLTWAYDFCPTSFAWMCVLGLVLYLVCFAPGMGPMPWTINSEIYPLWARSTGNAAATCTNWLFNLAISMSFLSLTETLTRYGTFWLYASLATLGAIFLGFLLPETKGKSLEEVEGLFAQPWCGKKSTPVPYTEKSVQYVHIRGLNRDGRDSELDSPE